MEGHHGAYRPLPLDHARGTATVGESNALVKTIALQQVPEIFFFFNDDLFQPF